MGVERRVGRGQNRKVVEASPEALAARAVRRRRMALAAAGLTAIALLSVGGVLGWRSLRTAQALRIREIRFRGLVHAGAAELLALSPVKRGDPLLLADLAAVQAALARHPWVRGVEVGRRWPPALEVTVRERTAAAVVDLGGLYLVDDDGAVFKRAAAGDGIDLPVVTGLSRAEYVQRPSAIAPLLQGALALVRAWSEGGREGAGRLSEIHVDAADGVTLYVGDDGMQVRLGTGELSAKLARLDKVLAALRAEGRRAEVLHLDNRVHPSWVTVRLADTEATKGGGR